MHSKGYSLLILAAAFLALPLTANAQSLARPDGSTGAVPYVALEQTGTIVVRNGGGITLTQSELPGEVEAGAVACGNNPDDGGPIPTMTSDNSWWRLFDLGEEADLEQGFLLTSAAVGIGNVVYYQEGTEWPADSIATAELRFYTVDGDFLLENLTLIGTEEIEMTTDLSLQVIDVEVSDVAVPADAQLAVELHLGAGYFYDEAEVRHGGWDIRAGVNAFGESAPTYISAEGCAIVEPTPMAAIGFPDSNWALSLTGTDATVANEDGAVARRVTLGQNFPNPVVSGATAIPFSLESAQNVTVAVFDALGREVTATAATFSAGEQSVQIDTSALPNGVYFYRINAGDTTQTRKMVVMQ